MKKMKCLRCRGQAFFKGLCRSCLGYPNLLPLS